MRGQVGLATMAISQRRQGKEVFDQKHAILRPILFEEDPKLHYNATQHRNVSSGGSQTILDVTNLGCVRGNRRVFSDVNFSVAPGTFLQVTGANGSGKTSLLRILCGLLSPAEGHVRWGGAHIHSLREEYFTQVTYFGHRPGVKDELTTVENLRVAAGLSGIALSKEKAALALEKVGLSGRESVPARMLSEGQRRRVSLARLTICSTKLWLLDEVLTALDKTAVAFVRSLIEEHLANGGMAIVATHHDLELGRGIIERLELTT